MCVLVCPLLCACDRACVFVCDWWLYECVVRGRVHVSVRVFVCVCLSNRRCGLVLSFVCALCPCYRVCVIVLVI